MLYGTMLSVILSYVMILLAMAFYTLVERKMLGYFQLRKGPNKISLMGIPQPLSDALKLLTKEMVHPSSANLLPFFLSPIIGLTLALSLWILYPFSYATIFFPLGAIYFLCLSSLTVYTIMGAGWSSNSKYSLLGALRSVAQTISYEVSMSLILLNVFIMMNSFNLHTIRLSSAPLLLMSIPLFLAWFTSSLAETSRTPFDFAEGESELVSGFNVEFSSGSFALIFMAEYMNIIFMSMLSVTFFLTLPMFFFLKDFFFATETILIAFLFVWVRASYPRMRYDQLMSLTWKSFLPSTLLLLIVSISLMVFPLKFTTYHHTMLLGLHGDHRNRMMERNRGSIYFHYDQSFKPID